MSFIEEIKKSYDRSGQLIFENLKDGEVATLSLHAEATDFVRFNANKVRQTTNVEQAHLSLQFQSQGRTSVYRWALTRNADLDRSNALMNLGRLRKEISALPIDPYQVQLNNFGSSEENYVGDYPRVSDMIDHIVETAEGTDFTGLLCQGPVIEASRNSLGQSHWFSTSSFFIDYSLYNGPLATKACYSEPVWNAQTWQNNLAQAKNQLSLMSRPIQNLQPGKYRVYLAPAAVSPIIDMFSWNALSQNAYKRGLCPFKKLGDGDVRLSEKFTLQENFGLGLTPAFNNLGELSEKVLPLIEKGQLNQFLTYSRTAKEFSVPSNAASEWENLRSAEVLPGKLKSTEILKKLETGLYLSNLHYLNWSDQMSARITGMTRYACFLVEKGEIVGPIKDLRFDNSLYEILGAGLEDLTDFQEIDPVVETYQERAIGGKKIPGILINNFKFTL